MAHPDWACAHVLVTMRRDVYPLVRKAYKMGEDGGVEQRKLMREAARRLEGKARALRVGAST